MPEHCAWAVTCLGDLAEGVVDGEVTAFSVTVQMADGEIVRSTFVRDVKAFDFSGFCVATMAHGKTLLKYAATRQGNAPLQNRSDREQ